MPIPEPLFHPPPAPEPPAPATFSCGLRHSGCDAAWISLGGHVDLAAAENLALRLEDAFGGARLVVVDLRELTFVDRAGVSAILTAHQRARRSGRRLVLVRAPAHVDRMLELAGLPDEVEITDLQRIPTDARGADSSRLAPRESAPHPPCAPQRSPGRGRPTPIRTTTAGAGPSTPDSRQPSTEDPTSTTLRSLRWLETEELWPRRHASHAREELVRRFVPLARGLAARYRSANEPFDDLLQVANLGLLRAIDRFDPGHGTPFPSYAIPTILGELRRHFRDTGWAVRVPRALQEMALSIEHASRDMTERLGRSPRVEELAQRLNRDIEDILDALQASKAHYGTSLDAPVTADPDAPTLGETLSDDEDHYPLIDTKLDLATGIRKLPYLERKALDLRLWHDLKQSEIAQHLGCSQMQVSRLLTRAASRLQNLDPQA